MINDITQKTIDGEPYRMFTSRCENRLFARHDNANLRLNETANRYGLISKSEYDENIKIIQEIERYINILKSHKYTPHELNARDISINQDGVKRSLFELMQTKSTIKFIQEKFPEINEIKELKDEIIINALEINAKYDFYIKQNKEESFLNDALTNIQIPYNIDYSQIKSLSSENIEKLKKYKPLTIQDAQKISGITPTALYYIINYIKKSKY